MRDDVAQASDLYPGLAEKLGVAAVAEMAACSYIVGMEAPGLYSVSMRYNLRFTSAARELGSKGLSYRVTAVDKRFRKATISIQATHIAGTLEALVREH